MKRIILLCFSIFTFSATYIYSMEGKLPQDGKKDKPQKDNKKSVLKINPKTSASEAESAKTKRISSAKTSPQITSAHAALKLQLKARARSEGNIEPKKENDE